MTNRTETASSTSGTGAAVGQASGVEDVAKAVRELARSTRELTTDTFAVAERELAMVINISAQIRDNVISKEALARSRETKLAANLRRDAHQVIDIVADFGTVTLNGVVDFFQRLVDEPRAEIKHTTPTTEVLIPESVELKNTRRR